MKITYKEAATILNYKQRHLFRTLCCDWYLVPFDDHVTYVVKCIIKLPIYCLIFVPICAITIALSVFEGLCEGLEDITLFKRHYDSYMYFEDDPAMDRARKIGLIKEKND